MSNELSLNIVIKIGDEYFAKNQPDSGLIIPTENLIVDDPQIRGVNLDIRMVSTPIGGLTFKLKDELEYISKKIMADSNFFLEKKCQAFIGEVGKNQDFSTYTKVANTIIDSVTKIQNGYSIKSKEAVNLLSNPLFLIQDELAISITVAFTTITLQDASTFPNSGLIKLGNEFIEYTNKNGNVLEGLTRAVIGSTLNNHSKGDSVYLVTPILNTNPMEMLLQIMLSKNGDLTNHNLYDVFSNGLGIDPNDIDITSFENLKDTSFLNDKMELYIYNEPNALKFVEKQILAATNTRLITKDGLISISELDQVNYNSSVIEINEDNIQGVPTWSISSNKIINAIRFKWDYNESNGQYEKNTLFEDADSIATFGRKQELLFLFKGIKSTLDGGTIIAKRAKKLLARLSTARGFVTIRGLYSTANINVGSMVLLNHRFLPKQGGGLGIYDQIELMSKSIDFKKGTTSLKLEYASFTGLRVPFIAPSPLIQSVIDQKTFTVPIGDRFRKDYVLRLWDDINNTYLPDSDNIIEKVIGNTIYMKNNFTTPLTTQIRIKMAEYNKCSNEQKNRYAFVGKNGGFFNDGSKTFSILF